MTDKTNLPLRALDALALALAEHRHVWTPEERELYESATHVLTLGDDGDSAGQ